MQERRPDVGRTCNLESHVSCVSHYSVTGPGILLDLFSHLENERASSTGAGGYTDLCQSPNAVL